MYVCFSYVRNELNMLFNKKRGLKTIKSHNFLQKNHSSGPKPTNPAVQNQPSTISGIDQSEQSLIAHDWAHPVVACSGLCVRKLALHADECVC